MAFYATSFLFDGRPCEEFGLILAEIGSAKQTAGSLGAKGTVEEDRIPGRSTGVHYGATWNSALSFPITMVASESNHSFDRYDSAAIAGWLTGHQDYKKLALDQPDMDGVYYKAMITQLEQIEVGLRVVGFTATVTCDGPYAYRCMPETEIVSTGAASVLYRNYSNVNDYYYPLLYISTDKTEFEITNETDGTSFSLSGMPAGRKEIIVDGRSLVLSSSDVGNLYPCWNTGMVKYPPRMLRGDNWLRINGAGTVRIANEFPWNIGY